MKKFLLLIILLMCSAYGYSQITYPRFAKDSLGQRIVLLTIKQAQALDNQTDLLVLFKKLDQQIGLYDSACIKVVNEKDAVIASQTLQINTLNEIIEVKNNESIVFEKSINNLKEQIREYKQETQNDKISIDLYLKEIKSSKWKYGASGGVLGIAAGIIIGIIFLH